MSLQLLPLQSPRLVDTKGHLRHSGFDPLIDCRQLNFSPPPAAAVAGLEMITVMERLLFLARPTFYFTGTFCGLSRPGGFASRRRSRLCESTGVELSEQNQYLLSSVQLLIGSLGRRCYVRTPRVFILPKATLRRPPSFIH